MADLHASDIADMANTGLRELGRGKITDISYDLQDHLALSQLLRKGRMTLGSGYEYQFNVLTEYDDNFRATGLFDVDNVNQKDGVQQGTVPWRYTVTGWTQDVRQGLMNAGSAKIIDFAKAKQQMMLVGQAIGMEEFFWGEPSSSTDVTSPFGIKYWLVYNATAGFNGGNNSNFSGGPGGLDRDTYANWKNYTFNYTNISRTDLVRKIRTAMWNCNFRPAIKNAPLSGYGSGRVKWGMYTTYDVVQMMEEVAEAQNDALGKDIASMDGKVTLRGVPVQAVPYLQSNEATPDPVVGINWDQFKVVFQRGRYMLRGPVHVAPGQHNVVQQFIDNSLNFVCHNPRTCFLGAKSTWH
jgi:hypothetical protein